MINSTLSEEILSHAVGHEAPREVWKALGLTLAQHSKARELQLKHALQECKKGNSTIDEYLRTFKNIWDSLGAIGCLVPDEDKSYWLLQGLGPNYESFTTTMLAKPLILSYQEAKLASKSTTCERVRCINPLWNLHILLKEEVDIIREDVGDSFEAEVEEEHNTPITPGDANVELVELRANLNSETERRDTLEQQLASIQDTLKGDSEKRSLEIEIIEHSSLDILSVLHITIAEDDDPEDWRRPFYVYLNSNILPSNKEEARSLLAKCPRFTVLGGIRGVSLNFPQFSLERNLFDVLDSRVNSIFSFSVQTEVCFSDQFESFFAILGRGSILGVLGCWCWLVVIACGMGLVARSQIGFAGYLFQAYRMCSPYPLGSYALCSIRMGSSPLDTEVLLDVAAGCGCWARIVALLSSKGYPMCVGRVWQSLCFDPWDPFSSLSLVLF
ncbi:hypothetical protein GIB67_023004 [Kingdonia uniflora]|uniref:Uncharacterized protein n=1 Tax=Kingdonia uniflora TaxID=39325 RepID=A0A7J7P2I7_9MAGN|nr:hypothetical protein GIB67_023004 [Kingdonia uniflora]